MSRRTQADIRREQQRDHLWPEMAEMVWAGADEKGYWCAPRVLPLLLVLMRDRRLVGSLDCSSVYVELLARDFGQGVVPIQHEEDHAYCAGYSSNRAARTWKERIKKLEELGFIKIAPKGKREIGYVLVIHHNHAVSDLRERELIENEWWNLYLDRLREVGAPLPKTADTAPPMEP